MTYTTPFHRIDGVIRDANNQEVRLWGVNYYAPFNHNYLNIHELGADICQSIDTDIRHFVTLGIDFVRIHIYEREITDRQGNIVENGHMAAWDYLIEELAKHRIMFMVTPIVWFNSAENQAMMAKHYAYWHVGVGGSFGFSNFYGVDEMLWNPEALDCQERYVRQLFARRSSISGKRLGDYDNVIAVEIMNEPLYPSRDRALDDFVENPEYASYFWTTSHAGPEGRALLRESYRKYLTKSGREESQQAFDDYAANLVHDYIKRMFAAIDAECGRPILHFHCDRGFESAPMRQMINTANLDGITTCCYLNGPGDFDSNWCFLPTGLSQAGIYRNELESSGTSTTCEV